MTEASRHLIDPELLSALETQFRTQPLDAANLSVQRREGEQRADLAPAPDAALAEFSLHQVGEASVRLFRPIGGEEGFRHPALLHLHGGGYVKGTARGSDATNAALAAELACVVASVEYRLAPEHPYPAAVEDAYAALRWLHDEAAALSVDPARIAISGESAGGGLAAALALLARDRGGPGILFQNLIYPMLDDRTGSTVDAGPLAGEFVWTPENNRFGWSALLGTAPGGEDVPAYAAPARAEDLSGLPPAFISVGALDLFLEENLAYATRLIRAGVPTELHVFPGAYHAFDAVPTARSSMVARNRSRAALRGAMHKKRS